MKTDLFVNTHAQSQAVAPAPAPASNPADEEHAQPAQAPSTSPAAHESPQDGTDGLVDALTEQYIPPSKPGTKDSQAELMTALAKEFASFFHTPDGEGFASIKVNDHLENVQLRSRSFKQWLSRLHYKHTAKPPGAQAIQDTVGLLEAEGRYDGEQLQVHVRYASHEGSVYIDLGNADWDQVRISREGWSIIGSAESPVRFHRTQGMKEMPMPAAGGSLDLLRPLLNIESDSDWILLVSWLVGSMQPSGPFPILMLQGEQGTAKSTAARILRNLVDPSTIPSQSPPRSERDLVIAASKSWVLNFDNLSYLAPLMSDAMCRLSTGGGFRTRALYTDDHERIFHSIRPMIMNGITDIATRHDLADRSLIIQLPVIPKAKRLSEREMQRRWGQVKQQIFGALCSTISTALANIESTRLESLPRMADFATWVTAGEPALPWQPGRFLHEYESNRKRLIEISLEADAVAIAVIRLIQTHEGHEWSGTPSELLRMTTQLNQDLSTLRTWPRQPNVFSGRLRRAATALREMGIEVESSKSGNRRISIYRNANYVVGSLSHLVSAEHSGEEAQQGADAAVFNMQFGTDIDDETQ